MNRNLPTRIFDLATLCIATIGLSVFGVCSTQAFADDVMQDKTGVTRTQHTYQSDLLSPQDASETPHHNPNAMLGAWSEDMSAGFATGLDYIETQSFLMARSASNISLQLGMPNFESSVPQQSMPESYSVGLYATPSMQAPYVSTAFGAEPSATSLHRSRHQAHMSGSPMENLPAKDLLAQPFEIGLSYGARLSPDVSFILAPSYRFLVGPSENTSLKYSDEALSEKALTSGRLGVNVGLLFESHAPVTVTGYAESQPKPENDRTQTYGAFATGLKIGLGF